MLSPSEKSTWYWQVFALCGLFAVAINAQAATPAVELDGTWQVTWGELLSPRDIPSGETQNPAGSSVWAVPQPHRAGGNTTLAARHSGGILSYRPGVLPENWGSTSRSSTVLLGSIWWPSSKLIFCTRLVRLAVTPQPRYLFEDPARTAP